MGFDLAALGVGLAGAFLVLALAVFLARVFIAPRLAKQRLTRPVAPAGAALRYAGPDELEPWCRSLHALRQ